jgi:hypothetical protein
MLLQNYAAIYTNPGRNFSGNTNPYMWLKASSMQNFYTGDAVVLSATDRSSFNNGYRPPYSWSLAPKDGGLASTGEIVGLGTISFANLAGGKLATANLNGSGTLTASIKGLGYILSALSGSGTLSADIAGQVNMAANLVGSGNLTGALGAMVSIIASLNGAGTLNGTIAGALSATADLAGSGDLTGAITGSVEMVAALTGTGTLNGDVIGNWNMLADLIGSGALTGAINGIGSMTVSLTGTGTLNIADSTSTGYISADISGDGDILTNESIANAVWLKAIEGTFTAAQCMELLTAVAAGKTTIVDLGGGLATITFRDINDTTDRVVADMTDSERTNVTLNL